MTVVMKGLRLKPKYEDLIGVAVSDKLYNIKFPNRDAKFLREGFVLSQLDGEGMRQMEKQQEMASKEAYKEHLLRQAAVNNDDNISHRSFRTANESDLTEQRITDMLGNNNAEFYDIIDTNEGSTQTDPLPGNTEFHYHIQNNQQNNQTYVHVEDHRRQIQILQQEAYNREAEMRANHESQVRQVQQDLRRRFYEVSGDARRRDLENQAVIQNLLNRINQQPNLAITDQTRLQAIEYQPPPQPASSSNLAIEDQPPESTHERRGPVGRPSNRVREEPTYGPIRRSDQQASSSSQAPQQAAPKAKANARATEHQSVAQPSDDKSYLFSRSVTDLLMIKGMTKSRWGKAKKEEYHSVLRDFNIPFDDKETNISLYGKVVKIFEKHGG